MSHTLVNQQRVLGYVNFGDEFQLQFFRETIRIWNCLYLQTCKIIWCSQQQVAFKADDLELFAGCRAMRILTVYWPQPLPLPSTSLQILLHFVIPTRSVCVDVHCSWASLHPLLNSFQCFKCIDTH